MRFLIAPPGFGKTVALLGYLRQSAAKGIYCVLPDGGASGALRSVIARALHLQTTIESDDQLLRIVSAHSPLEIALDWQQAPSDDAAATIVNLIEGLPDGISLLIASRSRAAFEVRRFVADGTAVLCDAERLAFDLGEIRRVAEVCGVPLTYNDAVHLLECSDGWPYVVSGALRKAAEDRCDVGRAFENWRTHYGHLFDEFVTGASALAGERYIELVNKLMLGAHSIDAGLLGTLEEHGLFVIHGPRGFAPLRAIARNRHAERPSPRHRPIHPMGVRLFGWFTAEIGTRPIEWCRRRDRQVFEYVALQHDGIASRARLMEIFWPQADKHAASQSLRTVCSNIRKAIARVVGLGEVDYYFRAGDHVSINLDNVIIDVKAFEAHANDGDEHYRRGDLRASYAHYRSAAALYDNDAVIADAHEQWAAEINTALRKRRQVVLDRIDELARNGGSCPP
ncbi:MAG: hypothetical protein JOZ77_11475 [Candidatus Eremiobacteraeota bacterium]|nr:hypothetical protein [Candidatus Eremiobacteraeota bacterium]